MLLTSCASTKPVSSLKHDEVAVPIATACVEPQDIPPLPPTAMRPDGDVAALAAGAAADIRELRRLAAKQNALLKACATTGGK